jgi:hypothetical protein
MSSCSPPIWNQVQLRSTVSPVPICWKNTVIEMTKVTPTDRIPMNAPARGVRFPNRTMRRKVASGMTGMTHALSITSRPPDVPLPGRSGSIGVAGNLGSGKSYCIKRIAHVADEVRLTRDRLHGFLVSRSTVMPSAHSWRCCIGSRCRIFLTPVPFALFGDLPLSSVRHARLYERLSLAVAPSWHSGWITGWGGRR